jgi:uncharacterized membrane protein
MLFCSRCAGLYLGVATLAIFWMATRSREREMSPGPGLRLAAGGAILLMIADAASSGLGWRTTTNPIRFLTGLLAGASLVLLAIDPLLSHLRAPWLRFGIPYRGAHDLVYGVGTAGVAVWVLRGESAGAALVNGLTALGCVLYLVLAFSFSVLGFSAVCGRIGAILFAPQELQPSQGEARESRSRGWRIGAPIRLRLRSLNDGGDSPPAP